MKDIIKESLILRNIGENKCPTCRGAGKIFPGPTDCPDCVSDTDELTSTSRRVSDPWSGSPRKGIKYLNIDDDEEMKKWWDNLDNRSRQETMREIGWTGADVWDWGQFTQDVRDQIKDWLSSPENDSDPEFDLAADWWNAADPQEREDMLIDTGAGWINDWLRREWRDLPHQIQADIVGTGNAVPEK
jgi:hypothetical protein